MIGVSSPTATNLYKPCFSRFTTDLAQNYIRCVRSSTPCSEIVTRQDFTRSKAPNFGHRSAYGYDPTARTSVPVQWRKHISRVSI